MTKKTENRVGLKAAIEKFSAAIHGRTEDAFEVIGGVVVSHPGLTIGGVLLFVVAMLQGVWFYDEELSQDKQFSPRGSRAVGEEGWVVDRFGYEDRVVQVMFEAEAGRDILSKESLTFMMSIHEWVTAQFLDVDGHNTTFDTVCARYTPTSSCKHPLSVLTYWEHTPSLLLADSTPLATINTPWRDLEPSGAPLSFYLGGVTYESGEVASARAARILYYLKNEKEKISGVGNDDPQSRYFEILLAEAAARRRGNDKATHGIGVYIKTTAEEEEAGVEGIAADMSKLVVGYLMMICYTTFILSRARTKYSHAAIGFVAVAAVALSSLSAYGFCWYIGVKYNSVVQVLGLVLLGVGIDDTFVIMDSWWDCSQIPDMKERMVKAVRHAGPAITITSVTDLIAFLAGSSTEIPALRDFCYYAAVGITFIFLLQVTLVVAAAYLDSVRQANSRADCLCCIKVTDESGICLGSAAERAMWTEGQRGMQDHAIGTLMPRALFSTPGRVGVLVMSAVWLGLAIYGCTLMNMNYNSEWFIPEGDPFRDVMSVRDRYFDGNELPASVYFGKIDYPNHQAEVLKASRTLQSSKWVSDNSTISWMKDFHTWVRTHPVHNVSWNANGADYVDSLQFYTLLKIYASQDTGPRSAWQHIDNLRWDPAGELVASRVGFRIIGTVFGDGQAAVDAMDQLRSDFAEAALPGDAFPWTFYFVFFESYKVMIPEVTQNVGVAGACVLVLVTLMIANIQMGFLVAVVIGCVDVCLLGFMPFIGVELNSVSVICIVLAVGLSVDYSVHIAGAFLQVSCKEERSGHSARTQRAAYAIWKMGPAVVNGGTSTFLAVLPAAFAVSYAFKAFFRMFAMIIFFGQWFGVLFLPVILTFIGPEPYLGAICLDDVPHENPLDPRHSTPVIETTSNEHELEVKTEIL